jgi:hypothetical protein
MRPRISRIDSAERFEVRSGPRRSVPAPRVAEHGPHVVVELRQVVREGDLRRVEGRGLARGVRAAPLRERGRERRARRRRAREDLGRTRVIQRRFNVSIPRARVPEKASTLRGRSKG